VRDDRPQGLVLNDWWWGTDPSNGGLPWDNPSLVKNALVFVDSFEWRAGRGGMTEARGFLLQPLE